MTSAYKILFTITLKHDYYSNKACNDFTIIPSKDCLEILGRYRLIYRQAGNKAIILTPVKDGQPSMEILAGTVFRFYLFLENVYFNHFTQWDTDPEDKGIKTFFFTNESGNVSEKSSFVTKPLQSYSDTILYRQGDLVVDGDGIVNESLQNNPSGAKSKPLSDKSFWKRLTGNKTQYATLNDRVDFTQSLLPLVTVPGGKIKLEGFDNKKNDFKKTIVEHTVNDDGDTRETTRIFSSLPSARYRLTVNGESDIVYYDADPMAKRAWGIIEIVSDDDLPKAMQILDAGKFFVDENDTTKLSPGNFILHFRNRSVLWKYKLRVMKDSYSISDSSANKLSFEKKESFFVSDEPIPLTEEPIKTLTLKKDATALIDVLKNPSINKLNAFEKPDPFDPQKKKTVKYFCSEIYLTI